MCSSDLVMNHVGQLLHLLFRHLDENFDKAAAAVIKEVANQLGLWEQALAGDLLFGTMDTWLLWNLTGGAAGDQGKPAMHVTDVTNASRTLLMDIRSLQWDADICAELGIPMSMLPKICPSVGEFGQVRQRDVLAGVPIFILIERSVNHQELFRLSF